MKKHSKYLALCAVVVLTLCSNCYGQVDSTRKGVDSANVAHNFFRDYLASDTYKKFKNTNWKALTRDSTKSYNIYLSDNASVNIMSKNRTVSYLFNGVENGNVVFLGENNNRWETLSIKFLNDSTSVIETMPMHSGGDGLQANLKSRINSLILKKSTSCCTNSDHKTKHCAKDWDEMVKFTKENKCVF